VLCQEYWVDTAALHAIAGGDMNHCVFFPTEELAQAAGYRPCAVCLLMAYASREAQQCRVLGQTMS
jgi:methylphosphotriester-DNA--protein-cysteine methyltransferase